MPKKEMTQKKSPQKYNYVRVTFTYEGRRYTVRGKTPEEAFMKKGEKLAALKRGEAGISGNMSVKAWCRTFISTYVVPRTREPGQEKGAKNSLTPKSAKMYSEKIDGYILPAIGGMKMKDILATHLQKIVNSQAGKSYSHVNKLMNVIHQLFHRAYLDRVLLFDPSDGLTMPEVIKKIRRSLTLYEQKIFHQVCFTHKQGLWAEFHLQFGLREGEVPPLQVCDLDFNKHRLHVSKAVESGSGEVKAPKTEAGKRYIPIPPDFEPRIKAYVSGLAPFDYLFPSEAGGMMTQSGINRRWKSIKWAMDLAMGAELDSHQKIKPETSRIARDLSIHCLRHTLLYQLGRTRRGRKRRALCDGPCGRCHSIQHLYSQQ